MAVDRNLLPYVVTSTLFWMKNLLVMELKTLYIPATTRLGMNYC